MAETTNTEVVHPLIAELWARTKDVYAAYQARGTADETTVTGMRLQMRAMALLASSVPAESMADLGPKVLLAALFRGELFDSSGYALTLIETSITADMRALQGGPLNELL